MRRKLAAAVLTAAFLCLGSAQPAAASARGTYWRSTAVAAINRFATLDDGSDRANVYADAAGTFALLYGWDEPHARAQLAKVYALRNPDGGWGINEAWDAFQDGTVNPASTTYTVTLAGHVGPKLLSAYAAGLVPRADVQRIVDLLMSAPRVPVSRGVCVAYSLSPNDAHEPCVHNVNAGVARFLVDAANDGFGATGMHRLITEITLQEVAAYNDVTQWWPYLGDTGPDEDADHNSYEVSSMYRLAYWVGRESGYKMMSNSFGPDDAAPLAHVALTSLPRGVASLAADGTTSMWCVLGDRWHAETDAYLAGITEAGRASQLAYMAALNSRVCP